MNEMQKRFRWPVVLWAVFISIISLFFFVSGPHLLNNNRFELARRMVCENNLEKIQKRLAGDEIKLTKDNIERINSVLKEFNYRCPSGLKIHSNEEESLYCVFVDANSCVMIKENKNNHDCSNFVFTDLPYENYYLYQNKDGTIMVGEN